jgi:hypothetical protein
MRVIIAGSRHCKDLNILKLAISNSPFDITEVVSGGAKGVDTMGEEWAKRNGIPVKIFPANWSKYGRGAGPIRNAEMANYADALIAIAYSGSRGTRNMIQHAMNKGLEVHVHEAETV